LYKSVFKNNCVSSLLIYLLLLTIKYIFTEMSCRCWMLWFFSAYMQNMMRATKEYAHYCSQTYFFTVYSISSLAVVSEGVHYIKAPLRC